MEVERRVVNSDTFEDVFYGECFVSSIEEGDVYMKMLPVLDPATGNELANAISMTSGGWELFSNEDSVKKVKARMTYEINITTEEEETEEVTE